jgi:hypothetical protein
LRRIIVIGTALGVLVVASAAYAAINTYTAPMSFSSNKAGTAAKPVPTGFTQNFTASGTNGNRTAVLLDIKTKIYGLKVDGKDFPTCSFSKIANAHNDNVCPKGAQVASGSITAALGAKANFSTGGTPCAPDLHVWNSGQGKLTFFFVVVPPTHVCGGLVTGSTGPYKATYSVQGRYLVTNVPIPPYISFPAPGVAGSLQTERLVWSTHSTKVHGKTVYSIASVGCLKGKRPYSNTFTATLPTAGPANEMDTVNGSAACSK